MAIRFLVAFPLSSYVYSSFSRKNNFRNLKIFFFIKKFESQKSKFCKFVTFTLKLFFFFFTPFVCDLLKNSMLHGSLNVCRFLTTYPWTTLLKCQFLKSTDRFLYNLQCRRQIDAWEGDQNLDLMSCVFFMLLRIFGRGWY